MKRWYWMTLYLLVTSMLLVFAGMVVQAQESEVTADEVNRIAKKLYCPVCENIPLDTCGTAACSDWRYEIQLQLEQGMTEQEIIDDFVARFGERVVGTPQDPVLHALSVATPWIITLLATLATIYTLIKLRTRRAGDDITAEGVTDTTDTPRDHFQQLLEQDVSG